SPSAQQGAQQINPQAAPGASGSGTGTGVPAAPGVPSGPVYGGGGGDTRQCPLSGAPVRLYGAPEVWSMQVAPCEDFIRITTAIREGIFSPQHRAYQRRGLLPLTEWNVG